MTRAERRRRQWLAHLGALERRLEASARHQALLRLWRRLPLGQLPPLSHLPHTWPGWDAAYLDKIHGQTVGHQRDGEWWYTPGTPWDKTHDNP